MRVVLQRVKQASVVVDDNVCGEITSGLLLLCGFGRSDQPALAENNLDPVFDKVCNKLLQMRIFPNSDGKLDYSVNDIDGQILLVPQFTLYGKAEKGRRPDFTDALPPGLAEEAFIRFRNKLSSVMGKPVPSGIFGADMAVSLINDGPFTLQLEFDLRSHFSS